MISRQTPPQLRTLIVLTATGVVTLNMFLPSLPAMTRDLNTSASVMKLAVSGYMLMSAVLQILLGPLSDRLGRRPVMLAALVVYVIASLGCVLAHDVALFLMFRLAQGTVIAGVVLSNAIIRDQFSAREAAGKMGTIAAAMGLAPMLGPMIGGLFDSTIGWRMIFVLYTCMGALALGLAWADLGETRIKAAKPLRMADYAALLRSGLFWAYVLCQAFSVGAFYIFLAGVPFVATQAYGLSSALVGVGLGSITGGYMLGAAMTSRLAPRFGLARLIIAGRLVPCLGLSLGLLAFWAGLSHPALLFGVTVTVGIGNGLTISNANAGALSVRPELAGTAAGLSGALAIALGAALTWATALIIDHSATPITLLVLMLASTGLSLVAGWAAIRRDIYAV